MQWSYRQLGIVVEKEIINDMMSWGFGKGTEIGKAFETLEMRQCREFVGGESWLSGSV